MTEIKFREEWAANSVFSDHDISVFADKTKTENGTGSGIFSDDLS